MILVTGGTGNVGANVVRELLDAGERVRILSREPHSRSFPDGVEVVRGDLARPESLPAALSGVGRAFLMSPAFAGADGFLDAARRAGLRHVVLLSSSSVLSETPGFIGGQHQRLEQAVLDSGLPWTFVRPGAFMTNDLAWAPQIGNGAVVRGVYGNAAMAPVDPRDIAAVAVRALLERRVGEAPVLTGPQSLTQIERVRIIAEAIGRPLRFEEVPPDQYREQMLHHGMLASVIDQLIAGLAARDGTVADISPVVEEIAGRPAFTYAQWAAHRAAAFDPALV
ncbi:NAD(P)H-binding protein [Micromonospora yasonensis]|uniref:NAD(P)H-binding protein n=1 Tax=Micromonospora yasonensis TaxID=1128667 RepID=UPI0022324F59|nr:NAD(P)H-binding protein [Micromonospora yasonensis]MCW3841608.1 NAD(P)H-binding protein [Micromonospora yasonensis]